MGRREYSVRDRRRTSLPAVQQQARQTLVLMTTPPHKLIERLENGAIYDLRATDGHLEERISSFHALGFARMGLIEGVGPKSGVIKFLRRLRPEAVEEEAPRGAAPVHSKPHGINAQTGIGSYRQALETGTVWALCLLRARGI